MRALLPHRDALRVVVLVGAAVVGLDASSSATAGDPPTTGSWSDLAGGIAGGSASTTGVRALAVFDDGWGDGPVLYAAGRFLSAGGVPAIGIARWDGHQWSDVGGLTLSASGGSPGAANAMVVWPTPNGEVLVVAGAFSFAGGVPAANIAAWDGRTWSPLGAGLGWEPSGVIAADLAVQRSTDPRTGDSTSQLYVAGTLQSSGTRWLSPGVATFEDGVWTSVGPSITSAPFNLHAPPTLCFFDDGDGPRPYVGGQSLASNGAQLGPLATLKDDAWVAVDGIHPSPGAVWSLEAHSIDGVDHLFVGGSMGLVGVPDRDGIVVRRQGAWSILGNGVRGLYTFTVSGIAAIPDGLGDGLGGSDPGTAIYVAGQFVVAGGTPATNVARWNGTFWTELAGGVNIVPASQSDQSDQSDQDNQSIGAAESATFLPPNPFSMVLDPFAPASAPRIIVAGRFPFAGDHLVSHIAAWTPPEVLRPGPFPHRCAYDAEPIPLPGNSGILTEDELVAGFQSSESFVIVDGELVEIVPPPPATLVVIRDVNDAHVAVGSLDYETPGAPGGSRGFRLDLETGEWTIFDADAPPCNSCSAAAIGNDGTIYGRYQGDMYAWVDGVRTFVPLEPGWGWMDPRAANAIGEAVGTGYDSTTSSIAASHFDGTIAGGLGQLPGLSGDQARRINDHGTIIGEIEGLGVVWEDRVPSILAGLDGEVSDLTDINNSGVIIGRSESAQGSVLSRPTIWIDGVPHSLRELVDWRTLWQFRFARRLTEAGTILTDWAARPFTSEPDGGALLRPRLSMVNGDVDGDCRVNGYDLGLVLVEFGLRDSVADLDGDGAVDGFDLGLVLSNWTP